jgi:hypothetical protein
VGVLLCGSSAYAASLKPGGKGTAKKPYVIRSGKQWNYVATHKAYAKGHFRLGSDIVAQRLRSWNWPGRAFSGTLNGNNKRFIRCSFIENTHTVKKGKKRTRYYSGATAITRLKKATIKNLTFASCRFVSKVKATHSRAAAGPFFTVTGSRLSRITVAGARISSANKKRSAPAVGIAQRITNSKLSDCTLRNTTVASAANTAAGIAVGIIGSDLRRIVVSSTTIVSRSKSAKHCAAALSATLTKNSHITLSRSAYNTIKSPRQAVGFVAQLSRASISESYVRGCALGVAGKYARAAAGLFFDATRSQVSCSSVANTTMSAPLACGFARSVDAYSMIQNCFSEAVLATKPGQSYPFMINGNISAPRPGIERCFGAWRPGYSSVTGGAKQLTPFQITADGGDILELGAGAGQGRWTFSAGNYPCLKRNP